MRSYKNKVVEWFDNSLRTWLSDAGSMAAAFALMAPVVVGTSGAAMDFAMAHLVKQRLGNALDASGLAAAASATDPQEIEDRVQTFFEANYPPEAVGMTYNLNVEVIDEDVIVTASADYPTSFLGVLGMKTITVSEETIIHREVRGLEVVLVMDNTGSMSTNNNIGALRTAATSFVDILFAATDDPAKIKIGLVPYSNTVRVGRYGLGLNPDGTVYGDGTPFVTLPAGLSYTTTRDSANWYGCVTEHRAQGYEALATHANNSKGQLWRDSLNNWDGHGWDPASGSNDPYSDDVLDDYEGPWDVYAFGRVIAQNDKCHNYSGYSNARCSSCSSTTSSGVCNTGYCFCWRTNSNNGINDGCPHANIMPLSSSQTALNARISEMQPDGNTLGNIGMVWGYRLISPDPPFTEGADWDDEEWRKAIIMMTDGDNTVNSVYSSFWFTNKNDITVDDLNERFEETCETLKEQNVTIYTVTFTSAIDDDTKGYYRRCATDDSKYFDAPSQADLIDVFEQISRELANLHISG